MTTQNGHTQEQRTIMDEIKRLHDADEPLNITAVKRRHPELLRRTYTMSPFWGWTQAIKESGVDYSGIRIELLDLTTCQICGEQLKHLCSHLARKHKISGEDYRRDYPEAEIVSEETRSLHSTMKRVSEQMMALIGSPWREPVWSPEAVLDLIAAMKKAGQPINHGCLIQVFPTMSLMCPKYFGTFDNAFARMGLDPAVIRLTTPVRPTLTRAEITGLVKGRWKQGLSLSLLRVMEEEPEPNRIVHAARFHFKSWRDAVMSAGIDYPRICPKARRFLSKQDVIKEIRNRRKKNLCVSRKEVCGGEHKDKGLYAAGKRLFGAWKNAIEAAGLSYEATLLERHKYPNKTAVIREIRRRARARLPIIGRALNSGPRADYTLVKMMRKYFGCPRQAVEAAGLSYRRIVAKNRSKKQRCRTQSLHGAE